MNLRLVGAQVSMQLLLFSKEEVYILQYFLIRILGLINQVALVIVKLRFLTLCFPTDFQVVSSVLFRELLNFASA